MHQVTVHRQQQTQRQKRHAQGVQDGTDQLGHEPHHNSLRNLATGMPSCSRYLATVRRAML